MRVAALLLLIAAACGKDAAAPAPPKVEAAVPRDAAPDAPDKDTYATLGDALVAILPADARVLGFGEYHVRTDRAQVRSALSHFTEALTRFGASVSDLVVETWIVDPKCGQKAQTTTKQLETEVKRPEATKSEVALLADAAKAAGIQPHAMTLSCKDYETLNPNGQVDPVAMLTLTTRELARISTSAIKHRANKGDERPWIAVYGGALHNDREPDPGVAEWSYAAAVDAVAKDGFVEVDLIVPELVANDDKAKAQPWFPLVERASDRVAVFARSPRSFVVVLPKAK